ncbi:MAG: type II secretion system protein [Planctomycetota bacterium]
MMTHQSYSRRRRAFSLVQVLVMIALLVILGGMLVRGLLWVKYQANIAMLTSNAHQIGTALHLYYQKHRTFPSAYPGHLEQDLAQYVSNEELFTCPANPAARAAPLNASYITPVFRYEHAYILGLDSRYDENVSVVLFSNATTEVVEKLPILHNEQPFIHGNRATGGIITFGSGSTVELTAGTTATVANSFRSQDGTAFNIVKFDEGVAGSARLTAVDTDIIELASYPGLVFMRGGTADVAAAAGETADELQVSTQSGEVRVIGSRVSRASSQEENEEAGEPEPALSGRVNINPSNNSAFRFRLKKPDDSLITRTDLLESNRQLEYVGAAKWILFRPKGNGNQNSLMLNGKVYSLQNGKLYFLFGSDLTVRLYNDKKYSNGNAMGRWWLDSIHATDGRIIALNWSQDELPPDDDDYEQYYSEDDTGDDENPVAPEETVGGEGQGTPLKGQTVRTLSKGICVPKGKSVTVTKTR